MLAHDVEEHFPFDLIEQGQEPVKISLRRTFQQLVAEIHQGGHVGTLSAKFHNTLAETLLALANAAREKTNLETVALSGGVFCNHYLVNRLAKRLNRAGFAVLWNRDVPANDGGISVGQAAIAARIMNCE